MTADEARGVLELAAGASADEVRKAYTRLVKLHTPERDPEGFQRVRGAYELLKRFSPSSSFSSSSAPRVAAPAPAPAPVPAVAPVPAAAPVPAPAAAPAPVPAPIANDDARDELFAALDTAAPAAAIALMRAHLRERPADDEVRWMLFDDLAVDQDESALDALLEAGVEHGRHPSEFAAALLGRNPAAGSRATLDAMRDQPRHAPVLAVALAARDQEDDAVRVATAAIEDAARRGQLHERNTWIFTAARVLALGDVNVGIAILASTDRWLPDDVKRQRTPQASVTDLLVHELAKNADALDDDLFVALARTIVGGPGANDVLAAIRRADPIEARHKYESLVRRSSTLASFAAPALIASALAPARAEPARPASGGGRGFAWVGVVLVMGVFRMLSAGSHTAPPYDPAAHVFPRGARPPPTTPGMLPEERVICDAPGTALACSVAHDLARAIEASDCDAILRHALELETIDADGRIRTERARDASRVLRARAVAVCPMESRSPPEPVEGAP